MRIYLQNLANLQFSRYSKSNTTWSFAYDAAGMRTQRTNGSTSTAYTYTYNGNQLTHMTCGSNSLHFYYDASGRPLSVVYNGATYYYVLSLQGDVVAILNSSGVSVVEYAYDAWGRLLTTTGSMSGTLGLHNPLRYRGYIYDRETGLYYLQSRYYNPTICRFINADIYVSTGQGILGYNMFAYCLNNPVSRKDISGTASIYVTNGGRNPLFIGHIGLGGGGAGGGGGGISDSTELIPHIIDEFKDFTDIPVVDNLLAVNKIRSGAVHIYKAGVMILVPGPTPINGLIGVARGVYGVITIVLGITDWVIPAEDER